MRAFFSIIMWMFAAIMTIAVLLALVLIAAFLFPFDRKKKLAHAQGFWWAGTLFAVNPFLRLKISGVEHIDPRKTYVMVANHQSMMDIMLMYKTHLQFKWVAKDVLFRIPVFGWCMSLMGYIRLERGEYSSIKEVYQEAAQWLRKGISVLFFPEGTRSSPGELRAFKNGAFKLAIKEQKPILPICITGSGSVIPRGGWILREKTFCTLTVIPPIETAHLGPADVARLRDLTAEKIAAQIR